MNDEMNQVQDPALELPSDVEPQPAEPTAPPMQVIPADEFFDRLAELLGEGDSDSEESEELTDPEETEEPIEGVADLPVTDPDPVVGTVEQIVGHLLDMIIDLGKIEKHTAAIEGYMETVAQTVDHPALTTSFADYTVTEALLLLLLLAAFLSACARMIRGGFSWLRS